MATLSDSQIAAAAKAAGFTDNNLVTAVAVALAESGGNPNAKNVNTNSSTDDGLWQINSIHREIRSRGNVYNPIDNAKMAKAVFDNAGGRWTPWVVYKTGRYRMFLPRALRAAKNPGTIPTSPAEGGDSPFAAIAAFIQKLADPRFWMRVGMFVIGGLLILIALVKSTGNNQLSPLTKKVVGAVVTRKVA